MKLIKLTLTNFKGAKSFELTSNGESMAIRGDNGTGKTTVADAFFWLLFDKDSLGRKDFEIKTIEDGETLHHLDHWVEAVFDMDGKKLTLKKLLKENWVKPRGSQKPEFEGHVNDHWVNGVPVKKGEFDRHVAGICDESRFRLLTDPSFFNERTSWQDRRKTLLQIIGDVSTEDVIAGNKQLADVPELLNDMAVEDRLKVLKGQRAEINRQIETIPARIDELNLQVAEKIELPKGIAALQMKIALLNERKAAAGMGTETAELTKTLRELEAGAIQIENELRSKANAGIEAADAELHAERTKGMNLVVEAKSFEADLVSAAYVIERHQAESDHLKEAFRTESAKEANLDSIADSCPACGQSLPEDRVEAARQRAIENFNEARALKLESIREQGQKAVKLRKDGQEKADGLKARLEAKQAEIATQTEVVERLKAKREAMQPGKADLNDPRLARNIHEQDVLRSKLDDLKAGKSTALEEFDVQIREVQEQLNEAERIRAKADQQAQVRSRLETLADDQRRLSDEVAEVDGNIFKLEEFIRVRARSLTEKINSRFELVEWRLFDEQINGGLKETCEATVNGVPYSDLNHGKRVNAGLEIIKVLANHYKFAPPIFIDGAESVTRYLEVPGQTIKLIVDETKKSLAIEHDFETALPL